MPKSLLLTDDQIADASAIIATTDNKMTLSQVSDLLSIFRGYLGELASNYDLYGTFTALQDTDGGDLRCAKLVACLTLFQDNQFTPESGFAATPANKSGFNYSMDGEVFEIFKYAFGLFWDFPRELVVPGGSTSILRGLRPMEGRFLRHRR